MCRDIRLIIGLNMALLSVFLPDAAMGEVTVIPSLTLQQGFDTNPGFTASEEEQRSNFVTSVSPRVEVSKPYRRFELGGFYSMRTSYYSRESALNAMTHNAALSLRALATKKMTFNLSETYTFTQESVEANRIGYQTRRTDIESVTTSASLGRNISESLTGGISLLHNDLDFRDAEFVDASTDSASVNLGVVATPKSTFNGTYTYSSFKSDKDGGTETVETHSGQFGVSYKPAPGLNIYLSGGIVYLPTITERYNWVATAEADKSFQRTTLNLSYTRHISNAAGVTTEVTFSDRADISLGYNVNAALSFTAAGSYSKNKSQPSGAFDSTSYTASLGASWRLNQWSTAGISYSHFQQWSESELALGSDISRDQVYINITATTGAIKF